MKKLLTLLALLAFTLPAAGQSVGASQIKKKADAGIVADSANALALGVYRGTSAPASPVTGQLWLDTTTTPATLKAWGGSSWTIPPNGSMLAQAELTSFPADPTDGQMVWIRSLKRVVVYDAVAAAWYYLDSQGRVAGTDYSLETAGYSSTFLTPPATPTAATASGGSMTNGTHVCGVTFYNSTGGETLPVVFAPALNTTTPKTINMDFEAGGAAVAGKRIYCSKANTATPLFLVTSINDASTTTYAVTGADSSFLTQTAPDTDFSAPLPSGWVFYWPDYTYGGCGSTGATLLCAAYKVDAPGTGVSGLRLFYPIPAPSTPWRASWRVIRALGGFPGFTTGWAVRPVWTVSRSYTDVAPVGRCGRLTVPSNTDPLPFSTTNTPALGSSYRSEGAAWVSIGSPITHRPWPPFMTVPFYLTVAMLKDGTSHVYRGQGSQNGKDWTRFGGPTSEASSQTVANVTETGSTGTTAMAYVGIAFEAIYAVGYGMVYEFDSFTLKAE